MSNIQKRKRSVKRPMSTVSLVTYYALSKNPFDSCDWYEWYALQAIGISLVNCMLFWPAQVAPKNAQWPRGGLQLINNWHWRPWKIDKADCMNPLARMVRLYPERQRNQSTYLLVLPCDFMRQLGATIVLLLNLTNFIIKQINFPALEKKKTLHTLSASTKASHTGTPTSREISQFEPELSLVKQSKPYVNCFGKVLKPKSTDRLFIYNFNYFWRGG